MYLGIDIGGTKTIVAAIAKNGTIHASRKFETPKIYKQFLKVLDENVQDLNCDFDLSIVAAPGKVNRDKGLVIAFGNLDWKNIPLLDDVESIAHCPTYIENDTKLAGLSEAIYIKNEFKKVLYITISTGINSALIVDGVIDKELIDSESGDMLLEHDGKLQKWESFASGKAIVKKYGKRASEITNRNDWNAISRNFALGIINLIAVIQPEVIVIGGGVGSHFKKFQGPLHDHLKRFELPLVPIPPIRAAQKPEEAVIFGCYYLAKYQNAKHN
jgi:glucokinase